MLLFVQILIFDAIVISPLLLLKVLDDTLFALSKQLGLGAPRFAEINQIHNDLFEHEDGEEQTADIHERLVDEGGPAHPQVTVEEAQRVSLPDARLLVLLLVLLVLQGDHFVREALEVLVEFDDGDRVDENADPQARQLVLFFTEPGDLHHPEAQLLHAEVPDDPRDDHGKSEKQHGAEEILPGMLDQY